MRTPIANCPKPILARILHTDLAVIDEHKINKQINKNFNTTIFSISGFSTSKPSSCMAGLGLENYDTPDSSITASSEAYDYYRASKGRLYQHGSWAALSHNKQQWFQVDFGNWTKVTGVAIQGNLNWVQWVKKFKLADSYDGLFFREYQENGDNVAKVPFYCR